MPVTPPEVATSADLENKTIPVTKPPRPYWDWVVIAAMLLVGLAGAWIPVGWTRDLKRYAQPPYYWGLAVAYCIVYGIAVWWVWRGDEKAYRRRGWVLAALVLLPNILNIWVRYTAELGPGQSLFGRDSDVGLYFNYGHEWANGLAPTFQNHPMEYPQGALLFFWLGERLSGGQLNTFYWVFPTLMLVFQLVASLALFGIGCKIGRAKAAFLLAAFSAGTPFLMLYNYTRFDMAPTALLLLAVYAFLPGARQEGFRLLRRGGSWQSGLAISAGFLAKWLPAVLAPFLAVAYFRSKRWRQLGIFGAALVGLSLIVLVPFYLADANAFWYPYQWQNSRRLTGESFWYLLQYQFLDVHHTVASRPWSEPDVVLLGNRLLSLLQVGLVAVVFGVALWRLRRVQHLLTLYDGWAAAGLLGVVVFTMANRVFSPQYWILVSWTLAAVMLLRVKGWRETLIGLILLTVAGLGNYLVFQLGAFPEQWIPYSWLFFVASLGWFGWLVWRTIDPNYKWQVKNER